MKEFKCYECEESLQADSREEILRLLYTHYTNAHPKIIPKATAEEKKGWMVKFEKDWAEAPEVQS